MVLKRLRIAVVMLISLFGVHSLLSQEAVDIEKSPKPGEKSSPEETPEKAAKKETTAEKPARGVEETMRPEEFKAAGLDKLSEDELQHLDAWLKGYRQSTQKKATEEAKKTAMTRIDTVVSRVDGSIEGIKGHTVIRLEDGTTWKQANADDR